MKREKVLANLYFNRDRRPVATAYLTARKSPEATLKPFLAKHLPEHTGIRELYAYSTPGGIHLFWEAAVWLRVKKIGIDGGNAAVNIGRVEVWGSEE